ncbi:MAG: bifunctional 5,10-methylene-tetrahydrofolate dehydrogenase/5,10-methylene-tetrahydrofolate cyclohydrolase [Bacteroidetes bacterium RIFOXYA12_FULL_35_11]|nr:MAG: bifunctional 5,10-methylene-tetrahydrofolate dehydrogenase/5,10-methylene-tetrahydrofolate cyclohydrolase [Bacteroidetes bacterium GWF2_35_48]OFY81460.1 MAG: bifunctional 5,10-methylene-tetrahydrofolate dehydrogenase/5,10-methylene-tetrahydrofolate cyclohydrolase [Bacteroidetes bacterium RIFOXYA12_FULL_35_11]HBX50798.1 bifunctional 5,10-methylene-tetrahydrofolate dehydrogenase/5,10-methylene-tetrahydrofolate cyclohydrolase [Bacteroidales bacterium]
MQIIDGNKIAAEIKNEIAEAVTEIKNKGGKTPHLAAMLIGNDGASETYVGHKVKACEQVGFKSTLVRYDASITEKEVLDKVIEINNDPDIDGLIVQLPLPKHISEQKVLETINFKKDVDGFHPVNVGRMVLGLPSFIPATPFGIIELFRRYNIPTEGKNCVILGRSNIVGTPMNLLMSRKAYPGNCTVTICHSKTKNIEEICRNADIIIVAMGIAEYLKADMVKDGAVVIDVGITRVKSDKTKSGWKLLGDVKFDEVAPKCSYITPVPGGVGPMTIVSLLKNTLSSARNEIY